MATKPISLDEIPKQARRPAVNRQADVKAFLRSGQDACEVVVLPNEKPDNVYAAYHNAVTQCHAERLIRVTRRFDRVFLVRMEAPFTNNGMKG